VDIAERLPHFADAAFQNHTAIRNRCRLSVACQIRKAEVEVSATIDASCHCGAVHLAIDAPPQALTDCNCSICRRYGVLWTYYSPKQVKIVAAPGATDVYLWGERSIEFHRCKNCGCITHWAPVDATCDRMGVNARLMEPAILRPLRIRKLDGAVTGKYLR
jgi:hypothetical protein